MSPRLSIIPAGAVTDPALEPRDLQVLCLLGRHTNEQGWCSRSQVKMAAELNCSRSSVQRSLDRLYDAGWVQKKRRGPAAEADSQPSSSYAYRVILDRDDEGNDHALRARHGNPPPSDTHYNEGCPRVGTPADAPEGAQPEGHPGAQPYVGTGAQPYVGTKNDPLERPPIQRERDARARDVEDFLKQFRAKWPTAAADDQQRLTYAAHELEPDDRKVALDKIDAFLALLKRLGRKGVPAGWRYLEEKRWTMLEQQPEMPKSQFVSVDPRSDEGRAVMTACAIARAVKPFTMGDGKFSYRGEVTPQLLALSRAPHSANWLKITDRQQLGAWSAFVDRYVTTSRPPLLRPGDDGPWIVAPWPWPPRVDGTLTDQPQITEGTHG